MLLWSANELYPYNIHTCDRPDAAVAAHHSVSNALDWAWSNCRECAVCRAWYVIVVSLAVP